MQLSDDEVLLATAGDDGAVAFSRMSLAKEAGKEVSSQALVDSSVNRQGTLRESWAVTSTLLIPKAHASAVTALQYMGCESEGLDRPKQYRILTSGHDQRLKTWLLAIDLEQPRVEGFAVSKERNVATAVADVSAIGTVENGGASARGIVLAGIGLEVWSLDRIVGH